MQEQSRPSLVPYLVMLVGPAFFSTNIIFGRFVSDETAPFVLAFMRWAAVAVIVAPLALRHGTKAITDTLKAQWPLLALLGFLGMGICGGGVYLGLKYTSATNATLIYTTSPVLIILLEQAFFGRKTRTREIVGAVMAFAGVAIIVARGSWQTIAQMSFNQGDLLVALASLAWAIYSILYRSKRVNHLKNVQLFFIVAIFGALANLPFALPDIMRGQGMPHSGEGWLAVAGIVIISSVLAFLTFQYGVRALGASVAGLFMYLLTPYGVMLAITFLGEELQAFHVPGIALVMTGIIIATFPGSMRRKPAD